MKMKKVNSHKVTYTQRGQCGYVSVIPENIQVEFLKWQDALRVYNMLNSENEIEGFMRFYLKKFGDGN